MALPDDVSTFTLKFGEPNGYTDVTGALALIGAEGELFTVDPSTNKPINVKDTTTGHPILPKRVPFTIGSDGKASVTPVPHTGQSRHSPAGWALRAEWKIPSGERHPSPKNLTFVVPSGAIAYYDLLVPAATVPAVAISQPTVASVAGLTGAPTAQQLTDALDEPLRAAFDAWGGGTGGGSGVDAADVGYDLVLLLGQSNMQGVNTDYDARTDPLDSRVFSFDFSGTYGDKIASAMDPLTHPGGATGAGPGLPFARWYARTVPTNRAVLLVPVAVQGTPLTPTTGNTWNSAVRGSLYDQAVTQTQQALAAAGPTARIVAALWLQGESDGAAGATPASGPTYQAALDALITRLRADLAIASLPFLVIGMSPEWIASGAVNAPIAAVHASTPSRVAHTGYLAGPSGVTGNDNTHYTAAAMRIIGRSLVAALASAKSNLGPSGPPAQVTGLTAGTAADTSVPLSWNAATGAASYTVQRSSDGGTTWTAAATGVLTSSTTITGLSPATTYSFRVLAVNSVGAGTPSAAVSATTAASPPTPAAPGQVTGLTVGTPAETSVPLAWTAPSAGTQPITDYVVQYRVTGSGSWSTFADGTSTATTATVTGLTAATGYEFQVAAVNSVGTGAYSATATATTAAPAPASIADNFDRADSTTALGSTSTGSKAWTALSGTWGIAGGQAYASAGGSNIVATIDAGSVNYRVEAKLAVGGGGATVLARCTAPDSWYGFHTPDSTVYRRVGGTATAIAGPFGTTVAGDTIGLSVQGSTVTAYRNGTQIGQVTDTQLSTGGPGLRTDVGAVRFDDFTVTLL